VEGVGDKIMQKYNYMTVTLSKLVMLSGVGEEAFRSSGETAAAYMMI
jgi:hypothetical protein